MQDNTHKSHIFDEFGRNKLHHAANNGAYHLVRKILGEGINEGINIDAQDNNGWTALHFAANSNHFEIIDLLLEYKANPNLHDEQGNGPLWVAAMNAKGKYHGVLSLLKSRADPNHKNNYGRSPIYIANLIDHGLEDIFIPYLN
jgi:ankyrin repeat protein